MITLSIINAVTAVAVSMALVYMFCAYHERFNWAERLGLSITASGMLLRVGPILGKNILKVVSPYDDWSPTFLHIGVAIFVFGRLAHMENVDPASLQRRWVKRLKGFFV